MRWFVVVLVCHLTSTVLANGLEGHAASRYRYMSSPQDRSGNASAGAPRAAPKQSLVGRSRPGGNKDQEANSPLDFQKLVDEAAKHKKTYHPKRSEEGSSTADDLPPELGDRPVTYGSKPTDYLHEWYDDKSQGVAKSVLGELTYSQVEDFLLCLDHNTVNRQNYCDSFAHRLFEGETTPETANPVTFWSGWQASQAAIDFVSNTGKGVAIGTTKVGKLLNSLHEKAEAVLDEKEMASFQDIFLNRVSYWAAVSSEYAERFIQPMKFKTAYIFLDKFLTSNILSKVEIPTASSKRGGIGRAIIFIRPTECLRSQVSNLKTAREKEEAGNAEAGLFKVFATTQYCFCEEVMAALCRSHNTLSPRNNYCFEVDSYPKSEKDIPDMSGAVTCEKYRDGYHSGQESSAVKAMTRKPTLTRKPNMTRKPTLTRNG